MVCLISAETVKYPDAVPSSALELLPRSNASSRLRCASARPQGESDRVIHSGCVSLDANLRVAATRPRWWRSKRPAHPTAGARVCVKVCVDGRSPPNSR
jgi:hypothetical protein